MPALGRLPAPDPRDRAFRLAAILPPAPIRRWRYYWSGFWGDQGNESSCVGFSWMHWLVSAPVTQRSRNWTAEARNIYYQAQLVDEWEGTNYEGTSVRAGAKVLAATGFISEYRWAWDGMETIRAVLDVGPVVVGTNWYDGMFNPDSRGHIKPTGSVAGGHAYLIDGASLDRGLVRLKNSWGRGWGLAGRAYMTITDFSRLIAEDGEAALAAEIRSPG